MRIGKKWAIQSCLFAIIATAVVVSALHIQLRQHSIMQAEEKAKLILQEKQATIAYVVKDLRPPLFKLIKEQKIPESYFDPSWMSATYINRIIMTYFNDSEFNEYYYKNAAVNARSPENEADPFEREFLQEVRADNSIQSKSDIIEVNGKPFFIYMEPNRLPLSEKCMRCHGTPENAPADLVKQYGPTRSFYKEKEGFPAVLSLRIPLDKVYQSINTLTLTLSMFIGGILAMIFLSQWFLVKRTIISPIKRLTAKSTAITQDDSLLGQKITIKGSGELVDLADAFSAMSEKLASRRLNLEAQVENRTEQLKRSRDRAKNYLNIAGVMIMALNRAGEIILINPKGCEILEISQSEALGKNWFDHFVPPRLRDELIHVFEQIIHGDLDLVEYYENPILTASGEEKTIAFHNSALTNSEGEVTGILWSGDDITDKMRLQEESKQLNAQLRQAHKMEAIGTLAGGIAHDFNNLLAAIIGYAEMAQDDIQEGNPAKHQIDQVLKAGHRAKNLVKQILTFSRKEAGERIPLQLYPIIKETLKLLRASLPTTIEMQQDIALECGNILADPTAIHQVIMNLCTNGAHAMEPDGGTLHIDLKSITIKDEDGKLKPGSYNKLTISDTGVGIDRQHLERIFDPYFTTKEVGKGSGMGLSVVMGIVKSHDGVITVASTPESGTTFEVYFPEVTTASPVPEIDNSPMPTGDERLLIVDDEENLATMFSRMIGRLGYATTTKFKSSEALELFRKQPHDFDLVITDQTMPGLTGDQLAKELLQIRPDLPIIICSGFSPTMNQQIALSLGLKAYIAKPVDIKEMARTIRQTLDAR